MDEANLIAMANKEAEKDLSTSRDLLYDFYKLEKEIIAMYYKIKIGDKMLSKWQEHFVT